MSIDIIITENPAKSAAYPTGRPMTFIENITAKVDGVFSWTIEAFGGFATAHFEMVVPEADAWEMLQRIGKRVAFLSPDAPDSTLVCWEGMIHAVNVDDGSATVTRTLENCYNTVRVNFTAIDIDPSPPQNRGYAGTDTASDTASVEKYGRRYLLYQAGEIQASGWFFPSQHKIQGNIIRDTFLAQMAEPRAYTSTMRRGGGSNASSIRVSVDCVGFAHELALNFHSEIGHEGATISNILTSIVTNVGYGTADDWAPFGGEGNRAGFVAGWKLPFVNDTDTTGIESNTITTPRFNFTDKTTRTYVDELMHFGFLVNGVRRRAFFGYYENRKFFYTAEPSTYSYITRRNDPSEAIYDYTTGAIVPPHLIRPARVIGVPDLLPDETAVSDVLTTARAFTIGTVEFTAPATVVLTPVSADPSGMWGTTRVGAT